MEIKKQAIDLTGLAVGIIVLGIVVAIGTTIVLGVRDSRLTDLSVYSTANETLDFTTASSNFLANGWVQGVTSVVNETGFATINPANYTVSINSATGQATIANTTSTGAFHTWNVTYNSYNTSRADWTTANQASLGLLEYGNWFDILVIVGVAGVVLSLIFLAFGRRADSMAGVSY